MRKTEPVAAIMALLAVVTALCYWPITRHGFVELDDPSYILLNKPVQAGLTWPGIVWAFTTGHASNWHPLTWISHMLDCQLFGLSPAGHHFTSLLLHALNSILVFLLLRQLTGAFWRSAVVAALFAWHPLHVESVAWAAERKDVLSTFFFLLSVGAYGRYATTRGIDCAESARYRRVFYALSLLLFALGLMSKPMLVTLPCVLLLLDFWPLQRCAIPALTWGSLRENVSTWRPLLREKIPFFALSLLASIVTYVVQQAGGAVSSLTTVPLAARIPNALLAYSRYLTKTLWPFDLSVFYPLPDHWPVVAVLGAALLLVAVSVLCVWARNQFPYLPTGWFWFLGTLVPTIGLVQVGSQSMADRYMYIPSIGLFMMLVWGAAELGSAYPRLRRWLPVAAAGSAAASLACTASQVTYWRGEEPLFLHAALVTPDNYLAYDHLAKVCERTGRNDEALVYYHALLRLKPLYFEGQYNMGTLLMNLGRLSEATPHLDCAVQLRPRSAPAQCNLGLTLFRQNNVREAAEHLQLAAKLEPQDYDAQLNLGLARLAMNCPEAAAEAFARAESLKPGDPEPHFLRSLALTRAHQSGPALQEAEQARQLASRANQPAMLAKAEALAQECRAGL